MPRKYFRRFLPAPHTLTEHRLLRRLAPWLQHPNLWHLNRRSVAGGVAIGLFAGLVPGPLQMLTGALLAILFRRNLPVAMVTTLYTNPLTIVPLYLAAYELGAWFLGGAAHKALPPPPDWSALPASQWLSTAMDWVMAMGTPLLIGLPCFALLLAAVGYLVINFAWVWHVRYSWAARKRR